MLFDDDELFAEVCDAKRGTVRLSPALEALRGWVEENFAVGCVSVRFDPVESDPLLTKPRLTLFLDTDADRRRMHGDGMNADDAIACRVLTHFVELVKTHEPDRYDAEAAFLYLDSFEDGCLSRVMGEFRDHDAQRVVEEFAADGVRRVEGVFRETVVFLETARAAERVAGSELETRLVGRILELARPRDEFGYLTPETSKVSFDSTERLRREFGDNLYHYFR